MGYNVEATLRQKELILKGLNLLIKPYEDRLNQGDFTARTTEYHELDLLISSLEDEDDEIVGIEIPVREVD